MNLFLAFDWIPGHQLNIKPAICVNQRGAAHIYYAFGKSRPFVSYRDIIRFINDDKSIAGEVENQECANLYDIFSGGHAGDAYAGDGLSVRPSGDL